ncbi:MAG: hypothetical protein EOO15_06110 [Chitinophagaceae bacterium]|nr:MAG: hypothetical protein EOO15_06110 [Chitinophagaceae bacterium]
MRSIRLFGVLTLLTLVLGSWGFLVHRTTTQLAIYQLPAPMHAFFFENIDELVRTSVRPDQRRNSDPSEASKHFIDLEDFGPDAATKLPLGWKELLAQFPEDSVKKYGYVPYWVPVMKERLTEAMRNGNKDSVLFYAADLAHYIEDAHVPLHTTNNHDGQRTGQKGMHSLWESTIPEIELTGYNLYEKHQAQYLKKPAEAIWGAVRGAHALLPQLFEAERETSKSFTDSTKYRVQMRNGRESRSYSSAFAKAYARNLGSTINKQLLASAHMVADFWYTCWVDAGKPKLENLLPAPVPTEKKAVWLKELQSYQNGTLLQDGLLRARQEKKAEGGGD